MHTIIIVSPRKEEEMDMHFKDQLRRLFPGCRIKVVQKYPEEETPAHATQGRVCDVKKHL